MIQLELRVMMKINTDQYFIISTESSSVLNAHDIKVIVLTFSHRLENHVNVVGNYFLVANVSESVTFHSILSYQRIRLHHYDVILALSRCVSLSKCSSCVQIYTL